MLPIIPQTANNWLRTNPTISIGQFPPNLVATLSDETQKLISRYILENYAWPQIMERMIWEPMWDKVLQMARIKMEKVDLSLNENTRTGQEQMGENDPSANARDARLADSVVYDAIERLTDLTHFVSFKEGMPVQYNIPKYYDNRGEDSYYHPFKDRIKCMNSMLAWNFDTEEIYRKHVIAARHFYTYGIAFALSEFDFKVSQVERMNNFGVPQTVPELTAIGTTFDPISIRRLWLNYRLSAFEMDYQPCPFFFDETPRFATLQNAYNPQTNPFGFLNLDKVVNQNQFMFSESEMQSLRRAMEETVTLSNNGPGASLPSLLKAEHNVEALWHFYPMLPLDPITGAWLQNADGTPVPMYRYLVDTYGQNLAGRQHLLRVQRNFYPRDMLPLYGTTHMPDLDSGLYAPSIGYLLWNHYREIVTCKAQYITNKDWINDPPAWVLQSSPAVNANLTRAGGKIEVNGPNDFGWRTPYDATQTTVAMMQHSREQAQTAAKSGDAILGKALGGRTSATEAQNAFQASMSAVTTPINIFNYDMMGGYAWRMWEYTATWFPPQILLAITGQMGAELKPEDLWLRVGLKWDVGSSYIETIVRSQNIQYILQSSMGDPSINRAAMWTELLNLWRFDAGAWVNDGGFEREVWMATKQALETFGGKKVMINPDQNHEVAMKVKTRFLEDQDSVYMTQYRQFAPMLIQQIQMHQQFLQLQLHQQLLLAKLNMGTPDQGQNQPALGTGQAPLQNQLATSHGQLVQQGGGKLN